MVALKIIAIAALLLDLLVCYCACAVSGQISRQEEAAGAVL